MSKRNYQTVATVFYPLWKSSTFGNKENITKKHCDSFGKLDSAINAAKASVKFYTDYDKASLIKVEVIDKTTKEVLWSYQA